MSTTKMANLWRLVKLSIRLGVPGTLVYITTQEGLWGSPEETFLFYQKVEEILPSKEAVIPKDQEEQLKAVVEKMRMWSNPNHIPLAERWNMGVMKAVKFLDTVPEYFSGDDSPLKGIEEKAKKLIS